MYCPSCGSKATGKIGVDQFYCWDCFMEFNQEGEIFEVAEDGSLVAYGSDGLEERQV